LLLGGVQCLLLAAFLLLGGVHGCALNVAITAN